MNKQCSWKYWWAKKSNNKSCAVQCSEAFGEISQIQKQTIVKVTVQLIKQNFRNMCFHCDVPADVILFTHTHDTQYYPKPVGESTAQTIDPAWRYVMIKVWRRKAPSSLLHLTSLESLFHTVFGPVFLLLLLFFFFFILIPSFTWTLSVPHTTSQTCPNVLAPFLY